MSATADPKQTSPKVIASVLVGLGVTLLGGAVAGVATATESVSTDDLSALGMWAIPAVSLLQTIGSGLLAWWKTDPLRMDAEATERAMAALRAEIEAKNAGTGGAQTVVG